MLKGFAEIPRQWVDCFNYFLQTIPPTAVGGLFRSFLPKSHPRQWVDASDPFYSNPTHGSGWMLQILSTVIPPTAVGG